MTEFMHQWYSFMDTFSLKTIVNEYGHTGVAYTEILAILYFFVTLDWYM